jgi:hypothetical protein
MIPTFDLRIGNWITANGTICQVTSVIENKVCFNGQKLEVDQEELHPIPITQELLERAGFKKRERTDLFDKVPLEGFSYHLYSHKVMIYHGPENTLCHWLNTRLVFVHQLQNFFYFLTGREIIISF